MRRDNFPDFQFILLFFMEFFVVLIVHSFFIVSVESMKSFVKKAKRKKKNSLKKSFGILILKYESITIRFVFKMQNCFSICESS